MVETFPTDRAEIEYREERQRREEAHVQAEYVRRRERAILLLTETPEERVLREAQEKYEARKNFLDSEIKRYKRDPRNFNITNSEIFGTKEGLSKEGEFVKLLLHFHFSSTCVSLQLLSTCTYFTT